MESTSVIASAEEYFQALPSERRKDLLAVRDLIMRVWPDAEEVLVHGSPSYRLAGETFLALASQKHFMVLYVMHYDLLHAFKNDLKIHDTGRSCIRFKRLDPAMLDLFDRIVKYTGSQMSTSIHHGKPGIHRLNSGGKQR